jgi:hypothetical protein
MAQNTTEYQLGVIVGKLESLQVDMAAIKQHAENTDSSLSGVKEEVAGIKATCQAACNQSGNKPRSTIYSAASGGITGAVVGTIIAVIEYFRGH